ncbi:H-NS histone family protein [Burkholderia sp. SIMBA_043]|uniref:H-NS histone family protein n=1 Tax=Burkholderia TaxID=32008 RepID=UPI0005D7DDEA|nr:H-NS histone family protein [Burkholderia vietnamiensis]AJY06914.1 H-NS histone family protein [Burkholderia vietnamiensis LMG 10929]KVE91460.1 hypothetical protein WJ01_27110 [Burkholderia vietnamiensis]KVM53884.1 hypothetical protein WJ57_13930 [Burkholderia vietnamiensis]KVR95187.1 hypothetical protein WK30_29485 [Burkholderia vietnamiensis]UBI27551.1 H-NS histone family protein [Burkholderia vietnamiensis]
MTTKPTPNLADLLAQQKALSEQIEALKAEEEANTIAQILAMIDMHGQPLAEKIVAQLGQKYGLQRKVRQDRTQRSKTVPTLAAKYRNPETGATWSGKGRSPAWIVGDKSNFLINRVDERQS